MHKDNILQDNKDTRIPIHVIRMESVGKGKFKVKLAETHANLIDMHHNGRDYIVVRNLGRGRYVMKPVPTPETIMSPKRKYQGTVMQIG